MTNPHCCCSGPGWCERHQIDKSETMFRHCQLDRSESIKYWRAWEQGQLGATAPETPELLARGLGDRVAKAIERTTRGRVKSCGGCKKRQGALNRMMPEDRYPDLTATPLEWDRTTRNLLYFVWPVASNDLWKWNLDQLKKRLHLFNGVKQITVATDNTTVSSREVEDYIGDSSVHVRPVKNHKRLREASHWAKSVAAVQSFDPLEITFCAHAKGVRLQWLKGDRDPADTHVTIKWTQMMYESCLDYPHLISQQLSTFAMTGAFKKYGQFTTRGNHRWHYSGTFYWFRNRDVFRRNWMHVDRRFFGTESWPGYLFRPEETACLFGDDAGDLYSHDVVYTQVSSDFNEWKLQNEN